MDHSDRKPAPPIRCNGCTTTWTGNGRAHCSGCHHTFAGATLFDAHRHGRGERGGCDDPAAMRVQSGARAGEPVMFLRDGIWCGPEMDEATKAKRFGERNAA